jgi:hypothetical protein
MPFIRFINEKSFIQVRNTRTGVVVFLNKTPLLIQRDSDVSLLLKNDTYVGYYKYTDVEFPSTANIDELIRILVSWVEDEEGLDRSGTTLIDIRTNFQRSGADVIESAEGGATSTYDAEKTMTRMTTTTNAATRIVRQSREYIPATFVAEIIVVMQAVLADVGSTTKFVTSRVGVFEDSEDLTVNTNFSGRGAFFEYVPETGETFVVLRSNDGTVQTDKRVGTLNWNIDPFDGDGPSGFQLVPTAVNLFVFDWDPVTKRLRVGVLMSDMVYYCHEFGREDEIQRLNAPVRWELTGNGTDAPAADTVMFQGKASVFHVNDPTIQTKSIDVGLSRKTVNENGDVRPMFSLRLRENSNRAKLTAKRLTMVNTSSGGVAKWELVINSTLTDANFAGVTGSFAEFSTEETESIDGRVAASGFIYDSGVFILDMEKNNIYVSSDVQGVPDTLTLRITNISGVVEILSGLDWYERE